MPEPEGDWAFLRVVLEEEEAWVDFEAAFLGFMAELAVPGGVKRRIVARHHVGALLHSANRDA
jgi:hypothetical protein